MATDSTSGSAWPVLLASLQLGCTSFGGPIAHLGYFERSYVRHRRWVTPEEYAGMVALCQVLPGPTSSQVGFLIGLHRAGWRGALAAWAGFTLPSVLLMYAFYVFSPRLSGPTMNVVLAVLKWVTVAVVAHAVWRMARTLCPDVPRAAIALLAAVALGLLKHAALPVALLSAAVLPVVVLAASAAAGLFFCNDDESSGSRGAPNLDMRPAWIAIVVGVALLIALHVLASAMPHGLAALADIFYRTGALVFGGGHVVLPLLHDALVSGGWLSDRDFLSGYAAAQVLPGPLFSVAAYFGASGAPHGMPVFGAAVSVLCLFLPGILMAVAGRSMWNRGAHLPRARAVLAGVNAGAVGILAAALYDPVLTGAMTVFG